MKKLFKRKLFQLQKKSVGMSKWILKYRKLIFSFQSGTDFTNIHDTSSDCFVIKFKTEGEKSSTLMSLYNIICIIIRICVQDIEL